MTSITAAIKDAKSDVKMYGQGSSYVIPTWDASISAWRVGHEKPYAQARKDYADHIIHRALVYLGMSAEEAQGCVYRFDCGSIRERIAASMKSSAA